MRRSERRHCPHTRIRGVYGDEINVTPGYRRLQCVACWAYLDGPVALATVTADEWDAYCYAMAVR